MNKKFILKIIVFALFVLFGTLSQQSLQLKAQVYTPGGACGFINPDVQFWANCSNRNLYNGCKTDPTQGTQWGWFGGSDITGKNFKTSSTNQLWMQVQCFVQLSFGPGCATPSYVEVKNKNTGAVVASQIKNDCTSLMYQIPEAGTYTATCYNNTSKSCTASYDTFTVYPRVPPCTTSYPGAASLIKPANGAGIAAPDANPIAIPLTYDVASSGWGVGCPSNSNSYRVEYSTGACTSWVNLGAVTTIPASAGLKAGDSVCWRVTKSNGSLSTVSAINRFTILNDEVKLTTGNGIQADVCKSGFSGALGQASVTNPINFRVNFTTNAANRYHQVWLAAVPTSGTNPDIDSDANILNKIKLVGGKATGFAVKVIFTGGVLSQGQVYAGTGVGDAWGASSSNTATSGNATGYGVILQDIKGATTSNGSSTNFKIALKDLQDGRYDFYTAAIIIDPSNNVVGSYDSTPGTPFVYKKLNATSTLANWGVDLTLPTDPTFSSKAITGNQFNVKWGASDSNGLKVKSYVVRDVTTSTLTDLSPGGGVVDFSQMNTSTIPDVTSYKQGGLLFSAIPASNAFVSEANIGTRLYEDFDPSAQTNYVFYEFMQDNACNQSVATTSSLSQNPWLISFDGGVSAGGGVTGISVPSGLDQYSDVLKDTSGNPLLSDRAATYVSTYGLISGNSNLPIRKQSKQQQYIVNYEDLTLNPPLDTGAADWYDYLTTLVRSNSLNLLDANTYASSNASIASGNTSNFLSVSAGTKKHIQIGGNLTIGRNVVCDTQSIFLVKGTITITPNLTVNNSSNGCLFVALGNINVETVPSRSGGGVVDSPNLVGYDLIEGGFFTDGTFIAKRDVPDVNQKGYGLMVKGSVTANDVTLQRDVNLNANQFQPSQVFYFDPRYREIFKTDLNYNKYSLREVGYVSE